MTLLRRRTEPTARDKIRLAKGAAALALPEPNGLVDMEAQLIVLHAATCAMQSLDDLGDDEKNRQAHRDMCVLQERYRSLEEKIRRAR